MKCPDGEGVQMTSRKIAANYKIHCDNQGTILSAWRSVPTTETLAVVPFLGQTPPQTGERVRTFHGNDVMTEYVNSCAGRCTHGHLHYAGGIHLRRGLLWCFFSDSGGLVNRLSGSGGLVNRLSRGRSFLLRLGRARFALFGWSGARDEVLEALRAS